MKRILFSSISLLMAMGCAPRAALVSNAPTPIHYSLPPLPYAYIALEPVIDTETMTIHHDKHHQTYVDNLNKALATFPEGDQQLEALFQHASILPAPLRNNGGGHYNHSFFWKIMSPVKSSGAPSPELLAAINASFGSLDAFKDQFTSAATLRFGSGWAWLVKTPHGLVITSTPNQDNPLMDTADVQGAPLLAVDVWEHAYYLKYRNKRADYLKNWWKVVNWEEVSRLYSGAQ